jgi:Uma2 family endonuclease
MRWAPINDTWTVDDLEDLPPTVRAEVHNGKLVIMSPARVWHQRIERLICNLLEAAGRQADTQIGIIRVKRDARVAEVAVLYEEVADENRAWHKPETVALVVEVWSPSSDDKDRNPDWYAEVGIPEYWLAEPIEGDKWGALITMYELARAPSGTAAYIETRKATLAELQRTGL